MELHKFNKTTIQLPIVVFGDKVGVKTDRLFVSFPDREQLSSFFERDAVKEFISLLHKVPNKAGLLFVLDPKMGLNDSLATDSAISVFTEAMGIHDADDETMTLAGKLEMDDLVDAVVYLMGREWHLGEHTDFSTLDGTYMAFRDFVFKNTSEAEDEQEEEAPRIILQ